MPHLEKSVIQFNSADGHSKVAGYFYEWPEVKPFCVLQLSHGMCEYIGRYEEFAAYMASRGVVVCGNDHIGHGSTAANDEELGYFGERGGRSFALKDLKQMNDRAHQRYPQLPLVLLGHSMGSFFARQYAVNWPESISGLIISGTAGTNPAAIPGVLLCRLLEKWKGARYRSPFMDKLVFGTSLRKIENPNTEYDWISRDEEIVAAYAADPKTTFKFTLNGFGELFNALRDVTGMKWANKMPKDKPILVFAGDADPVGNYSKGVLKVVKWLQRAKVEELTHIIYHGGRHEMLNEINRSDVYADVFAFVQKWWKPGK